MIGISSLLTRRLADDIARFAGAAELIVLAPSHPGSISPTDFGRADIRIAHGCKQARALLGQRERVVPLARAA